MHACMVHRHRYKDTSHRAECVCVCERETRDDRQETRESERVRERERDRQTDRQTDREREREKKEKRKRQRERERDRESEKETEKEKEKVDPYVIEYCRQRSSRSVLQILFRFQRHHRELIHMSGCQLAYELLGRDEMRIGIPCMECKLATTRAKKKTKSEQ